MNNPVGVGKVRKRFDRMVNEPPGRRDGENGEVRNQRGVVARIGKRSQTDGYVKALRYKVSVQGRRNVPHAKIRVLLAKPGQQRHHHL